jgi:hypothetical protein
LVNLGLSGGIPEGEGDYILWIDESVYGGVLGWSELGGCGGEVEVVFCDERQLLGVEIWEEEFGNREDVEGSVIESTEEAAGLIEVPGSIE